MKNQITNTKSLSMKIWNKLKTSRWGTILPCAILIALFIAPSAFAAAPTTGSDAGWTSIINFIRPWVGRLGGLVMVIGAIMFGLGWQRDDAEGKTRGIQTFVGGAIVTAAGAAWTTFVPA